MKYEEPPELKAIKPDRVRAATLETELADGRERRASLARVVDSASRDALRRHDEEQRQKLAKLDEVVLRLSADSGVIREAGDVYDNTLRADLIEEARKSLEKMARQSLALRRLVARHRALGSVRCAPHPGDYESPFRPITLFVNGTDLFAGIEPDDSEKGRFAEREAVSRSFEAALSEIERLLQDVMRRRQSAR